MKTIKLTNLYIGVVIGLIVGCKSIKVTTSEKPIAVPETFGGISEQANSANTNWQDFFDDENLVSLIDTALNNNQDLLITFQRIEMARANVRRSKGEFLPAVEGFGTAGQRKFGLYTMDGAGNATTPIYGDELVPVHLRDFSLGVQTSWEADVWGKLRNLKKAALAEYLASTEGRNWAVTTLVAEVAASWYDLLACDKELEIIRRTIELQTDAVAMVSVQKQAAMVNELAVEQMQAQLLNLRAREVEVQQCVREKENELNVLLGRFPQPIPRGAMAFDDAKPAKVAVGIPADLLQNRPDIRQAELELEASRANVKAARAAFFPSLTIGGAVGFQAFNPSLLLTTPESFVYNLFGSLAGPLLNRHAINAGFQSATAGQRIAYISYWQSILNGYAEVDNEISNLQNLERAYSLKNREAEILNKSVETAHTLFTTGRADYLEVILVQKNALEASVGLTDIKQRQLRATIGLYKALGGGWK